MVRTLVTPTIGKVLSVAIVCMTFVCSLTVPAAASQDDWRCQLRAYWGDLDGSPRDVNAVFGVLPGATDDWDLGIDSKKPAEPFGDYVYTWFYRPAWNEGYIHGDYRAPVMEGTSKRWGTALQDTWNVKTNVDNGGSGYFHPDCDPFWELEYPVAASIYITWDLGVVSHMPPEDYTFTLVYRGGISPKPAGTKLSDAMDPPAINFTWDMDATPYIVVPLWNIAFQPWKADCSGFQAPDTAKFFILVTNPAAAGPSCTIAVDPSSPQTAPATFAFTSTACCDEPFIFSWDFGDGASATGNPVAHAYGAAGSYTVTCAVTDAGGATGTCWTSVTVTRAGPIYVDCNSVCPDPDGSPDCPYRHIQDAIDVATDGDTVLVLPCIYYERTDFLGKAITVTSIDPLDSSVVEATVIDGLGAGAVVFFHSSEVSDSVLSGFTIRGSDLYGISCYACSPTIANNVVTENVTGICCHSGSPTITHNAIVGNGPGGSAGGVMCIYGSPTIVNNVIADNHSDGGGGGILCTYSSPHIANNEITGNSAVEYGGAIESFTSSPNIASCTIADNVAGLSGDALYCSTGSFPTVCSSIVWNESCPACCLITVDDSSAVAIAHSVACTDAGMPWPGVGNICAGPQFVDPDNGDYHLLPTSPCIDAGLNECAPAYDLDGDPRPSPEGGAVDMGADEYVPLPTCGITFEPSSPTTDDVVTFLSGGVIPDGAITSVTWDFGDGATASGDPAEHQYTTPGTYAVTVIACGDNDLCVTCAAEVTVTLPCNRDVAIDRTHCKMPAAGQVGQCKTGQIGARNMSYTESCDVVMRVIDNAGNVVFETTRTIGPGRRIRVRFQHCYTSDEVGRNVWTWEVWPVNCNEQTAWDNVYLRKVNVCPQSDGSPLGAWSPLWGVWRR